MQQMHANEYNLSIRISSDGFSLCVTDDNNQKLITENHTIPIFTASKSDISGVLENYIDIIESDYSKVELLIENNYYTIIPSVFFQPEDMDNYYHFLYPTDKKNLVLFNRVQNWNTVNIFSLPLNLYKAVNKFLPEISINHHLSYLLSDIVKSKDDAIHVWLRPKFSDIVLLKENKLFLINTFPCETSEDRLYYIFRILDEFKLSLESFPIRLYERENSKELQQLLSQYNNNTLTFGQ